MADPNDLPGLIGAVCNSRAFRQADQSASLLRFLADNPGPSNVTARTRGAIAHVFSRSVSPNLSDSIIRLNNLLNEYFADEGNRHSQRIRVITKRDILYRKGNLYDVVLVPNVVDLDIVGAFWAPYFKRERAHADTVIGYGVPLFSANSQHTLFWRDVEKNRRDEVPTNEVASYAFVTEGEALCTISLTRWFTEQGVGVRVQGYSCENTMGDLIKVTPNANVILLGTSRANGVMVDYLEDCGFPFVPRNDGVQRTDGLYFKDRTTNDGNKTTAYVLVSRRVGAHNENTVITIVSSTSGRAIEGIGQALVDRDFLTRILNSKEPPFPSKQWPVQFQLLFEVEVRSRDTVVGVITLKERWTL